MATKAAHKRLTREYATLTKSPTPYITAHPSEQNILEWHYILTGPPGTPYENGQYWGTLNFPSDYPFAPPAIRMHTPSGRFRCSERLCLSISDFHPKSFNPAWEVSTILLGVLSFMTGEEMTTGSLGASERERKVLAERTRWWNSTGGGSSERRLGAPGGAGGTSGFGSIKAGDGGKKFREQWPEVDEENWKWMEEKRVDPQTGREVATLGQGGSRDAGGLGKGASGRSTDDKGATMATAGRAAPVGEQGFLRRNAWYIVGGVVFAYVVMARMLGEES